MHRQTTFKQMTLHNFFGQELHVMEDGEENNGKLSVKVG